MRRAVFYGPFERLQQDRHFPVQKAIKMVNSQRNASLLGVDRGGWNQFSKITSFYSEYSHASVLAAAATLILSLPNGRQIGGEFDVAKLEEYRKEIGLSISACERLCDAIGVAEAHLQNSRA